MQRGSFRFLCVYLALYMFPAVRSIPLLGSLADLYWRLWDVVVPWVGRHVLHLDREISTTPTGSGDTAYAYVLILVFVVLSLALTAGWSLFSRRRREYRVGLQWLTIAIRFYLFVVLLSYGLSKVFLNQFAYIPLEGLVQRFGDASPMGLLWKFMAYSPAYNLLAGLAEVAGAVLLVSRRTTTLGAGILVAVMTNVFVLNMAYDVPVKQFSFHLLALAGFLVARDSRRLLRAFVLNRTVPKQFLWEPFAEGLGRRAWWGARCVFVVFAFVSTVTGAMNARKNWGAAGPKPPLFGLYQVRDFVFDGTARPPLLTDDRRWKLIVFNRKGGMSVRTMSETWVRYAAIVDRRAHTITLRTREGHAGMIRYREEDSGALSLRGQVQGHAVEATLRPVDVQELLLLKTKFRWVHEAPFNR